MSNEYQTGGRLSDLADFNHIELLLEPGQGGVVVASGALGDRAPFLGVWVVTAHQEAGHDAPWWGEDTHSHDITPSSHTHTFVSGTSRLH